MTPTKTSIKKKVAHATPMASLPPASCIAAYRAACDLTVEDVASMGKVSADALRRYEDTGQKGLAAGLASSEPLRRTLAVLEETWRSQSPRRHRYLSADSMTNWTRNHESPHPGRPGRVPPFPVVDLTATARRDLREWLDEDESTFGRRLGVSPAVTIVRALESGDTIRDGICEVTAYGLTLAYSAIHAARQEFEATVQKQLGEAR